MSTCPACGGPFVQGRGTAHFDGCKKWDALDRAVRPVSTKEWVVEAVISGWRVVNRLNPEEAVRDAGNDFAIIIYDTEAAAITMRDVLTAAGR